MRVLVEVDEAVWGRIRERARREGKFVKAIVAEALGRYVDPLRNEPPPTHAEEVSSTGSRIDQLRNAVNRVAPGTTQTAGDLARARESRRGDYEGESQVQDDEDF